jgi:hypothetical protein
LWGRRFKAARPFYFVTSRAADTQKWPGLPTLWKPRYPHPLAIEAGLAPVVVVVPVAATDR